MTSKEKRTKGSGKREMPLQGDEAVELYATEIARQMAALSVQADLLRTEIAESGQLLSEMIHDNEGQSRLMK